MGDPAAALALDAGELPLGVGLLALIRPALAALAPGGILVLDSRSRALRQDLPSWCRAERHEYLGFAESDGGGDRHRIARGAHGAAPPETGAIPEMPTIADPATGFAPRGASVERGGPEYPFTILERDRAASPDVAELYAQAAAAQWSADRDIPWGKARPLPPAVERALGQVFTFLAENELAALYVPARFLPRIHPHFAEAAMFLGTQLSDEARHIEVFLRRARLHGALGISSPATSRSLLSLLETQDFTEAAFLLTVLGEGTFLDLLRFLERHAPDECTSELLRRARADESRHVHFGLAHVRRAMEGDPQLCGRLERAVARRAATLHGIDGVPPPVQDALVVFAAGSAAPGPLARGEDAFRELLAEMHDGRIRRLRSAGFDEAAATRISDLHTPNFM